ncbi:MAG: hypothetical protein KGZ65_00020 [Sphingomonadales bacterium]|nr:hypothetical protein [Sphingomonadaceae bacterium]MBS3929591.1 hypothetical protein [Sphingomonadales bacterium]
MIVRREIYDAVAKGEPWVIVRMAKLKTVKPAVSKTGFVNGNVIVVKPDGEIHDRETFSARRSGPPHPVGATATLRYREYPKGWERGDPLPPVDGKGIKIIVTHAEPQEGDKWLIRWERVGPHRPVPAAGGNNFLARAHGYTKNADEALDREAPVMPSAEVDAMIADDLAARREQQRKHAERLQQTVEALGEGEHDTRIRRTLGDLDRAAAELRALIEADGDAA